MVFGGVSGDLGVSKDTWYSGTFFGSILVIGLETRIVKMGKCLKVGLNWSEVSRD